MIFYFGLHLFSESPLLRVGGRSWFVDRRSRPVGRSCWRRWRSVHRRSRLDVVYDGWRLWCWGSITRHRLHTWTAPHQKVCSTGYLRSWRWIAVDLSCRHWIGWLRAVRHRHADLWFHWNLFHFVDFFIVVVITVHYDGTIPSLRWRIPPGALAWTMILLGWFPIIITRWLTPSFIGWSMSIRSPRRVPRSMAS